jgi:hypothetical protein
VTVNRILTRSLFVLVAMSAGLVAAPTAALADACTPTTEEAISSRVDFVELKQGFARPGGGKIVMQVKEGESGTWTTSDTVGAVVGYGANSVSVSRTTSNSVTYTFETTETHELDLDMYPGAVRADLMAAVHVASRGWRDVSAECSVGFRWERVESTFVQVGWRLVTTTGDEIWDWPPIETPTVSGNF